MVLSLGSTGPIVADGVHEDVMQWASDLFCKKCHDHVLLRLAKKIQPVRTGAQGTAAAVPANAADEFRAMAEEEEQKKREKNQ